MNHHGPVLRVGSAGRQLPQEAGMSWCLSLTTEVVWQSHRQYGKSLDSNTSISAFSRILIFACCKMAGRGQSPQRPHWVLLLQKKGGRRETYPL